MSHAPPPSPQALRSYDRCRDYARRRARSFYAAFSVLPRERRRAMHAVYAFAGTADDAVDDAGTRPEREARVAAARRVLDAAYGDRPDEAEDVHPVAPALGDAARRFAIPRTGFEDLLLGMEQDLSQTRYRSAADLDGYCYRAASVIGLICLRIFGCAPGAEDVAARRSAALGKALQLTNILRDVREDAARGRIYFALDDLARHGVSEEDVLTGRLADPLRGLMAEYADRASALFDEGVALLPLIVHRRSRMCCAGIAGAYRSILDEIVGSGYDVFSRRASPSRVRRGFALLRSWSGALFGGGRSRRADDSPDGAR